MNTKNVLGIDEGAGAIKIWGDLGGEFCGTQVPSLVATDGTQAIGSMVGLRTRKPPMKITTQDGDFYVGPGAHDVGRPVENLDHSRFSGAPELRALTYGALSIFFSRGCLLNPYGPRYTADVIVGLPIEALTGDQAAATASSVKKWLQGEHTWEADGNDCAMTIETVRVTSQPVGAWGDALLNDAGAWVPERQKMKQAELGIVSVGMNTVELLVVRDRAPVGRFTAGDTTGVRRLLELCNRDNLYSRGELDTQLRDGALDYRAALPVWASEVRGMIERVWGKSWRRFASVVVVGGGAVLLRDDLLGIFGGKLLLPDDPVLSTARGLFKIGRRSAR